MTIATFYHPGDSVDYTPVGAVSAGTPVLLADGRAGIPANDIAAGVKGSAGVRGVYTFPATSAHTWSAGDPLYYDEATQKAVASGGTFYVGTSLEAKTSGQITAHVDLNTVFNDSIQGAV